MGHLERRWRQQQRRRRRRRQHKQHSTEQKSWVSHFSTRQKQKTQHLTNVSFLCLDIPSRWCYSPGWALASSAICLQTSRFLALSLHSFTPIFLRSMDTSTSHLILGLPLRLVAYSFPYIFFGIAVSCILSIWPSHRILWHLINLTMFSPLIMVSNSSFRRILHNSFSFTGPYIFRKIFLSNTDNALSSSMVSVHDSEPQVTTGRTNVRYIYNLLFLDMRLLLNNCLFA